MKSEKEIEDWLRETLEPPHQTKPQKHEVQTEVDKLVEERLSEFKPGGSRAQRTPHADANSTSSLSAATEYASSPDPPLFKDYAARPRSSLKAPFIIAAILAVCFAAGSIVIMLTRTSKTSSPPKAASTAFAVPSRESRLSPAGSQAVSGNTRPDTDSIPENPADISISNPNESSVESPDPGTASSPVEDEFLLEIEFPIPPLMESPREIPLFSDPANTSPEGGTKGADRAETPQRYKESPESHAQEAPIPAFTDEQSGNPVALESLDSPPKVLRRIPPVYPAKAFRRGIEGTVIINALISESGNVIRTKILRPIKGDFGFEKACMKAVREWRFQPAVKNGKNVKVWRPISIVFKRK